MGYSHLPLFLLSFCILVFTQESGKDYQLVRANLTDVKLRNLYNKQVDIWRSLRVGPNLWEVDFLCEKPCQHSPEITILDPSISKTIQNEKNTLLKKSQFNSSSNADEFFDNFRDYDEWLSFFEKIVSIFPNFVKQFTIGTTVQGRDIVAFTVTAPTVPPREKPGIHFQGLVHAREWLAPTTLIYVVLNLLELYETDGDARFLLDNIEWTIVPIVNVDGYIYTWTNQRLWRKNRRLNSGGSYGVDINRNWGPASTWCSSGSSTVPSSDTYCGTAPFSEPETLAMSNFLNDNRGKIRAGIDFHTYGPLLLWPWQYTYNTLPPADYNLFQTLGKSIEVSINAVNSQYYVSQQGSDLYPHSGGYIDYNWSVNGMLSFTLEGRGNNFVIPPSNIIPAGEEAYAGVVVLAKFVLDADKNRM